MERHNMIYPYLYRESNKCLGTNPKFIFGSALITIIIGALAFITALAWNDYARFAFKQFVNDDDQLAGAKLNYAFLATSIAIVLGFLIMYYVEGEKW